MSMAIREHTMNTSTAEAPTTRKPIATILQITSRTKRSSFKLLPTNFYAANKIISLKL